MKKKKKKKMSTSCDAKSERKSFTGDCDTYVIDVDLSLVHELDEYFDVRKFDVSHDDDRILLLVL